MSGVWSAARRLATVCGVIAAAFLLTRIAAVADDAIPVLTFEQSVGRDDDLGASAYAPGSLTNITTRTQAAFGTRIRVEHAGSDIVVDFSCDQPATPIVASQATDNTEFGLDDYVGVGIDTSGNGTTAYYFEVNPRGTKFQQATESVRYSPLWFAAARVDGAAWRARIRVPLRALTFDTHSDRQVWRFNFIRHVAAKNENYSWAADPVISDSASVFPSFADARYWPRVSVSHLSQRRQVGKPSANVFLLETTGQDRSRFVAPTGAEFTQTPRLAGVDFTIPVAPRASIVGTVSPDFSGIDQDQVTILPQQYRQVLAEYRPFFAQAASYFVPAYTFAVTAPPELIFYSPNIGPFDYGLKLQGQSGTFSVGALYVAGNGFRDTVLGINQTTPDRHVAWSVDIASVNHDLGNATADPRLAHDLAGDATIGFFAERLRTTAVLNYGIESGTYARSRYAYHSADFVRIQRPAYEIDLGYKAIGPEYSPLDGFTSLPDLHGPSAFLRLNENTPRIPWLKHADIRLYADRFEDGSGAAHLSDSFLNVYLVLQNGISILAGPSTSYERFYGGAAVGFPNYRQPAVLPFNAQFVQIGIKDGSPNPVDVGISEGLFENMYLQQYTLSTTKSLSPKLVLTLELDGNHERLLPSGSNNQVLTRFTLSRSLSSASTFSISNRDIAGTGGFSLPGSNWSAIYHRKASNGDELLFSFGSPSAVKTLRRLTLKAVKHVGG